MLAADKCETSPTGVCTRSASHLSDWRVGRMRAGAAKRSNHTLHGKEDLGWFLEHPKSYLDS